MGMRARVYKLTWPKGHEFEELEIRLSGMSLAELDIVSSIEALPEDATRKQRAAAIQEMISVFSEHLLSWTYEDLDGNPVGTLPEDVAGVDLRILLPAVRAWSQEVTRVPDPLPAGSPNTPPSPAPPAVMDLPSPNLLS